MKSINRPTIGTQSTLDQPTPTIADPYLDLLKLLSERQRRAIIVQLTIGYYDGWRPSRSEIADLGAVELNLMTVDLCVQRQRLPNAGGVPPSITNKLLDTGR